MQRLLQVSDAQRYGYACGLLATVFVFHLYIVVAAVGDDQEGSGFSRYQRCTVVPLIGSVGWIGGGE